MCVTTFSLSMCFCAATQRLAFFGLGKGVALKKIMKNDDFCELATVRQPASDLKETIITAGEKTLICLYGGDSTEVLLKGIIIILSALIRSKDFATSLSSNKFPHDYQISE